MDTKTAEEKLNVIFDMAIQKEDMEMALKVLQFMPKDPEEPETD